MLELYHWEPNGACARVMIALKEKGLEFESRYVDLLAFEQHSPAFLALSGTGETPVLVRDGEAFTESSYVCEHLDEAFPDPPLMPSDRNIRLSRPIASLTPSEKNTNRSSASTRITLRSYSESSVTPTSMPCDSSSENRPPRTCSGAGWPAFVWSNVRASASNTPSSRLMNWCGGVTPYNARLTRAMRFGMPSPGSVEASARTAPTC